MRNGAGLSSLYTDITTGEGTEEDAEKCPSKRFVNLIFTWQLCCNCIKNSYIVLLLKGVLLYLSKKRSISCISRFLQVNSVKYK